VVNVRKLQEAVANCACVMNVLCPPDYAPAVFTRVLVKAKWGEAMGDDRTRSNVVKWFFREVVRENCRRAVRRRPPRVYSEARERWAQVGNSIHLREGGRRGTRWNRKQIRLFE
jgi:hypothetical protein